jgi:hypothetical protein
MTKLENAKWATDNGYDLDQNLNYFMTGEMNFCFGCNEQYEVYVCLVCEDRAGCYYCEFDYSKEHCYSD